MKLQILITQYNETDEVVKPLLDSIAIQQGVNFNEVGVIICNDGTDTYLSEELLGSYKFHIEYWKNEHKGVSGTRNALMDMATADYIMFCDCDDMFVNNCGLYHIFLYIADGFDTLNSSFIEETKYRGTDHIVYITHEKDATFIHGKVHRRRYLIDNNIRWNEELTIHEDSFFNIQCINFTENAKYCETPFYLWKYRDGSVCRSDPKYMLKTYSDLISSNDALIDEFVKRGIMDKAMYFMVHMTFETYYVMNKPEWVNQDNLEYREQTEKRFAQYFLKHKSLWDETPVWDKLKVSTQAREKVAGEGMLLEPITIFDWLKGVEQCLQEDREKE